MVSSVGKPFAVMAVRLALACEKIVGAVAEISWFGSWKAYLQKYSAPQGSVIR